MRRRKIRTRTVTLASYFRAGGRKSCILHVYDESGTQLEEERAYFLIPSSGAGSVGTNYDETFYGYDEMGL